MKTDAELIEQLRVQAVELDHTAKTCPDAPGYVMGSVLNTSNKMLGALLLNWDDRVRLIEGWIVANEMYLAHLHGNDLLTHG